MKKPNNLHAARVRGEQIAQDEGFSAFPVDPFEIARRHEIEVQEKPNAGSGISGALIRQGDTFGILYSTHIKSIGFQRFSVAHELGHYFLDGHPDEIFDTNGVHESHAGFVSSSKFELEADHFAAGLLMPGYLFRSAISKSKDGLEGIRLIAEACGTSLTSTAIRYVEFTDCPAAIVISTGKTIDYCFMSESLKDWGREITWISKGTALPDSSLTASFNSDVENVHRALTQTEDTDIINWFGGSTSVTGSEEVVGLGAYGKTLTVVTFPNLPDDEELEEEERIEASLTPRFRR